MIQLFQNFFRLIFILVTIYFSVIGTLYFFEKQLVFHPAKLAKDYQFQFEAPFQELFLETPNGEKINALYFKCMKPAKGVVLYLHGNAENLQRWAANHVTFTQRNYDFLAIDYRGYGKSEGDVGEQAIYEDTETAYEWLQKKYNPADIIIYGRSLGTGAAAYLATKVKAKMLVLETPYNSIGGCTKANLPFLWFPFSGKYRFPNDEYLPQVSCPIYIFQGTKDKIVPYKSAIQLKPLLKEGDIFFTIEGGRHRYLERFQAFQDGLDLIL